MRLEERVYSVLVVSSAQKLNAALRALLPSPHYEPVRVVESVTAARQAVAERAWDYVIVNSPLPDEPGNRFAIDAGQARETVVLLLSPAERHPEVHDKMAEYGVFTLPKPTSRQVVTAALGWMSTVRERLRRAETKALSLEEKMEEIRTVNRAKWFLIREQGMDEGAAHRFIEKQAMDRCLAKREIAEEIIRRYS